MTRSGQLRAGLAYTAVLVPLALFCLLLGVFGLGRLGEDFCGRDAPPDAGGYRGPSLKGFPPTFVCEYGLRGGGTVTSSHRLEPSAFLGAWLLGTMAVLGGAIWALGRLRSARPG